MLPSTPTISFPEQPQQLDLRQEMMTLLRQIGPGHMMNTAYDTAWVARLHKLGEPMAEEALDWLREHQLADGSWGAEAPVYHHDRVICTLAAAIALAERGLAEDRVRLEGAMIALDKHQARVHLDPAGETIAFEMLFPALMAEAKTLRVAKRGNTGFLNDMARTREVKLARSPGGMISRFTTMAFSAEMAGSDGVHILDTTDLQELNGSIGYSPSATAYFALNVSPRNPRALQYLKTTFNNGGIPSVAPINIFEPAWALWNLALTDSLDKEARVLCQSHLDFIERAWHPVQGIGSADDWTLKDSDDTGLVYDVLRRFDRLVNLDAVLHYEETTHFRCFALEANPSVSANIHILGALRQAGLTIQHPSVQKVFRFLGQHKLAEGLWFDKWHASPYYATAHLIIACAGYHDEFVTKAIKWILDTQNEDGSWGYYLATAEETAYCLQALAIWHRYGRDIPAVALKRGETWLRNHIDLPYPPLWIGKCLYSPTLVIRSTVLSALIMAQSLESSTNSLHGKEFGNGTDSLPNFLKLERV
jgi:halimadienyl-diphosphate synthase